MYATIQYLHNPIIHPFQPSKILHNHGLQVLQEHEDVLWEIKNNAYANFWGVKEVYYGICASSEYDTWWSVQKNVSQYGKIVVNTQQNKTLKSWGTKT